MDSADQIWKKIEPSFGRMKNERVHDFLQFQHRFLSFFPSFLSFPTKMSTRCRAIKKSDGVQCSFNAKPGHEFCGRHLMANAVVMGDAVPQAAVGGGGSTKASKQAKLVLAEPIHHEFWRTAKDYPSLDNLNKTTRSIMKLWQLHKIPSLKIPTAFMILRQKPATDPGYMQIYNAAVDFCKEAARYYPHPHHPSAFQHNASVQALHNAVNEFEVTGPKLKKFSDPTDDPDIAHWAPIVIERHRAEKAEREARRAAEAAEAAARAAQAAAEAERQLRHAEFQQQLREAPVIFKRDPEGGIDLKAFATDGQNIHRSSVQNATQKAVESLMRRPGTLAADQDTLSEIVAAFQNPDIVTWSMPERCERTIMELTEDYFNSEAFSVPYGAVCDRVWGIIRTHEHMKELCLRLAQEVYEGRGMCSNGKMAHLINTLQGFDEETSEAATDKKSREVFQSKIALLHKRPNSERKAEAMKLFEEFEIPEAEHEVWLDALLDEEEELKPAGGAGDSAYATAAPARMNMDELLQFLVDGMDMDEAQAEVDWE